MRIVLSFSIVGLALMACAVFSNAPVSAASWVDEVDLKFTLTEEYAPGHAVDLTTFHYHGGEECHIRRVMTHMPTLTRGAIYADVCGVSIPGGFVGGGYAQGIHHGPLHLASNNNVLIPHPKMEKWLIGNRSGSQSGSNFLYYTNWVSPEIVVGSQGKISYNVKPNAITTHSIQNSHGGKLSYRIETGRFSNNGEWFIFDSPGYGLVRLNTRTMEHIAFGGTRAYGTGWNPAPNLGISADGRYAVSSYPGYTYIYDLDQCVPIASGKLAHQLSCKQRDIEKDRQAQTSYGADMKRIEFTNSNEFSYKAQEHSEDKTYFVWRKYSVSIGEPTSFNYEYLALGDSFASGEGAYVYKPTTDNDDNRCHVSPLAYPYRIGRVMSLESYESVACSGAVREDVDPLDKNDYKGQYRKNNSENEKLANSFMFSAFIPGEISQLTYLRETNPRAVTISVGGNDIGFSEIIKYCIMGPRYPSFTEFITLDTTCFDTSEERASLAYTIQQTSENLVETFKKLRENNRQVYVLGYPSIVAPGGNCAVNVQLDNSETDFAHKLVVLLNDAIEVAAKRAGVVYVDVEDIFNGRRLCETESKNTLIHGLTEQYNTYLLAFTVPSVAAESFHPEAAAGSEYAAAILAQTQNLTRAMPQPDSTAALDIFSDEYWSSYWQIVGANPVVNLMKPIDATKDSLWTLGSNIKSVIPTSATDLMPGSSVRLELHSDPVLLGEFPVDSEGNVAVDFTVPNDVPPGLHMLKIFGVSKYGEPLELFDTILVGHSLEDFDGDGIPNYAEVCLLVEPSGMDSDGDGQDDACDGTDTPPVVTELPVDNGTVPLPNVRPIGEEKNVNGSPETVAGNEEMAPSQPTVSEPQPQNNPPTSVSPVPQRLAVATVQQANNDEPADTDDQPQVLSATDSNDTQQTIVTTPPSTLDDKPVEQPTNTTYLWIIAVASTVGFVALVSVLLIARRR